MVVKAESSARIFANAELYAHALVISAGAFIEGTLVEIGTNPSLTLTYNFN